MKFKICIILLMIGKTCFTQIVIPIPIPVPVPEHGFLPGKKFPIYETIDQYDFQGKKVRVELYDERLALNLMQIICSDLPLSNTSELASPLTISKLKQYTDSLFRQSNIKIDSSSKEIIKISLEAIDVRQIGYGYIKVHGLCQIKIEYKDFEKVYCSDIVDGDEHSPLSATDFATRKTAMRFMASASIREVLEQFLKDFELLE